MRILPKRHPVLIAILFFLLACGLQCQSVGFSDAPSSRLAVIYNVRDPVSVDIAHYYKVRRGIPSSNMIPIDFDPELIRFSQQEFRKLKEAVDSQTPEAVQFFALAWSKTVRVECMSVTAAFAFGFNAGKGDGSCEETCSLGEFNPYADVDSDAPYRDLGIRPTMMLAAENLEDARALTDRGVASDGSLPRTHRAYLLITSDRARSVRQRDYERAQAVSSMRIPIDVLNTNAIRERSDVMFYFTGLKTVPDLETLSFLPGAIADHLTSTGGVPDNPHQMSALRWLEAGATGSYGTVVEPCNHLEKFPLPSVVMQHYLAGETLIESYWKSVRAPGQGVFIGEPLARPYFRKP